MMVLRDGRRSLTPALVSLASLPRLHPLVLPCPLVTRVPGHGRSRAGRALGRTLGKACWWRGAIRLGELKKLVDAWLMCLDLAQVLWRSVGASLARDPSLIWMSPRPLWTSPDSDGHTLPEVDLR